jgi:hypothetical protein
MSTLPFINQGCVVLRNFREYIPNLVSRPLKNQNRPFTLMKIMILPEEN